MPEGVTLTLQDLCALLTVNNVESKMECIVAAKSDWNTVTATYKSLPLLNVMDKHSCFKL
jgi:hypothetical protein